MKFSKAYIPYKGYYSTPFCRWQGSLSNENPIVLAAQTARKWFQEKNIDPTELDYLYYGISVAVKHMFYSHTWAAAMIVDNAKPLPALMVNQACTTSATCIQLCAVNIEAGIFNTGYALMSDRTSNGAHTVWANPFGPGGEVESENWVMDSFNNDPNAGFSMIQTAENVAKAAGITKEECDQTTLRRYEQYLDALANEREFQKKYIFPPEVRISRKKRILVEEDEGITPCTEEGLARLRPVTPEGVISYGAQTYPADGNCGFIVTTRDRAKALSPDPTVEVKIMSYGYARVERGYMASAPVPAAEMALENAGLKVTDMRVIKTHNPFIVNDIYMAKKMGIDVMNINNYGSSLIYGHPQSPTAGRLIAELIEELVILGGGYGLWAGCAAGDTAAAMVLKVE